MPVTITPHDYEFAASSGSNVDALGYASYFDYPPNSTNGLSITSNMGDANPFLFETGETYDLTWSGNGGGVMQDATIIRSDYLGAGQGAIVFEGVNSVTGQTTQIAWTPGFDLENWYWSNGGGPSNPKGFYTSDQDTQSFQYVCFSADTLIATPRGARPVGALRPGETVITRDNGAQPILWAGSRTVRATGDAAPVTFAPGALENERPLVLSPQHRVLLCDPRAEMLFGASQVWAPAKALVNGHDIAIRARHAVTYVHLLLAAHEVLLAENQPAESLFLGEVARDVLDRAALDEISRTMPHHVIPKMHSVYPILTLKEARLLACTLGIVPPEAFAHSGTPQRHAA